MLIEATEQTILLLLDGSLDWASMIYQLETFAEQRGFHKGMEEHHIEPERERTVFLWPLEHLAIHVAHTKLVDTGSNRAKVSGFVRPWPGSYRRILPVSLELKEKLISFGQSRPGMAERMNLHPNTIAARSFTTPAQLAARRENGKKSADKVSKALKGRIISWGDKISEAINAKGTITCEKCGKQMKDIPSNILQHQRSRKCQP